jgi:hypothetical protein
MPDKEMRMASLNAISHWDLESDVIVLGCGLAGIVAALEAKQVDPQASVAVLEKMPEGLSGGNSRVSGQSLSFPDDMAAYRRYQEALNQPHPIPERLMTAWVEGRTGQKEWVERKAAEVGFELAPWGNFGAEFPAMPGAECIKDLYTLQPVSGSRQPSRLERPFSVWRLSLLQGPSRPHARDRRALLHARARSGLRPGQPRSLWRDRRAGPKDDRRQGPEGRDPDHGRL